MPVDALQHVNIHAADVERSKAFYMRVLGLQVGPRPPVASVGYWLYLAEQPVIHLVQRTGDAETAGSGAIDHVAFRGVDLAATRAVLRVEAIAFREAIVPRDGTVQLFVHDPDGVTIELNFEPAPP
jgi:catechol 2,3-dioxygenase-like lactoylglutathione lyase family enzyme